MILYLTISIFRTQLENLLKVRKGVYQGLSEEISKEFRDKKISDIRQNRDMILENGPSQKLDTSDSELEQLLTSFITEANNNHLEKYEI